MRLILNYAIIEYMEKTFIENRDKRNLEKSEILLSSLPPYCKRYFDSLQTKTSTLTQFNYINDLKIFFYYLTTKVFKGANTVKISPEQLSSLKYYHFEAYLNWLSFYTLDDKDYKNSLNGKARKLASLKSFFNYLYKNDIINSNEISKVDSPKIHEKDIIRLEPNEVVDVLDEVEHPRHLSIQNQKYISKLNVRDLAIMYLFLGTGIRISELVGLDLNDFNFEENAFRITRKGGNKAIMYFPSETKDFLLNYYNERINLKPLDGHTNAFFLSTQMKRISVRAVENLVKKYTKNVVNLKNITPHKLRSTFGTNLYRETQDIYIVATMLGHKDVNTTKKHYAAITEDQKRETALKDVKLKK